MKKSCLLVVIAVLIASAQRASAQTGNENSSSPTRLSSSSNASHTARILGIERLQNRLTHLRADRACDTLPTLEELAIRQELLEVIQTAALDVDGVLAEIANKQGQLSNLRTSLESRRDKSVARLNAAALITGSAAGAAISATQFTGLGDRANNTGDAAGIGAGAASTILSIIATRKQDGPRGSVGNTPNMLAPLFDEQPVLNTYYPPAVLAYLQLTPAGQDADRGTRLAQLKGQWQASGRLNTASAEHSNIVALTSSANPAVKVSIQDISIRIAMLVDVAGRVSLMKRDLSAIMGAYTQKANDCSDR